MYGGKARKFYHKQKIVAYLSAQNQFKVDGTHVPMRIWHGFHGTPPSTVQLLDVPWVSLHAAGRVQICADSRTIV